MKLDKTKLDSMEFLVIDGDRSARVVDKDGFKKLMVFYRHKKPVWSHKDCLLSEPQPKRKVK